MRTSTHRALAIQPWPSRVFQGTSAFLGADEGENVLFAAVFAHEGGGEAQATATLNTGGGGENGGGQEVDLVVDDQAPVFAIEEFEVEQWAASLFFAAWSSTWYVATVTGAMSLVVAAVFGDFVVRFERGLVEQLGNPLADGGGGGSEDERGGGGAWRGWRYR